MIPSSFIPRDRESARSIVLVVFTALPRLFHKYEIFFFFFPLHTYRLGNLQPPQRISHTTAPLTVTISTTRSLSLSLLLLARACPTRPPTATATAIATFTTSALHCTALHNLRCIVLPDSLRRLRSATERSSPVLSAGPSTNRSVFKLSISIA